MNRKDTAIDPQHLLKLRLCVARFGEMDLAGWWNTKGVLANIGKSVFSRGFPGTHSFARSRVVCAVAAERCREVFSPPRTYTLWNMPPEVEDLIDSSWQGWCRSVDDWKPFFSAINTIDSDDLLAELAKLELVDGQTVEAAKGLRRGAEGKGVVLPGNGSPDRKTLMLLAAAFSRGEKGKLAVPYIRSDN